MTEKLLALAAAFATAGTAWTLLQVWRRQAAMAAVRLARTPGARGD